MNLQNILNAPFIKEYAEIIDRMYLMGWDERNAGNVSYILYESELEPYKDQLQLKRAYPLDFDGRELAGKIFLITGTGKYFRNVKKDPELTCGIIQINPDGVSFTVLWGLSDGTRPTSELNTHLHSHQERLRQNKNHRVIIHTHATHLNAVSVLSELDERSLSRALWKINTENIIIFPEGIGMIPWEIPGNKIIGENTANKFKNFKIVLWPLHGTVACGETLDATFGLIETANKAAEVFLMVYHLPNKLEITDSQLRKLAKAFHVQPNEAFLDKENKE